MTEDATFEARLRNLETLVTEMEQGELPLEKLMEHYEKGLALSNELADVLKKAELKIETLSQNNADSSSSDE